MSVSDPSDLLSSSVFAPDSSSLYLNEFIGQHELPLVAKVQKGNYFNSIGSNSVHQHLLLVNIGKHARLLAQNVKFGSNATSNCGTNNGHQVRQLGSWQTYGPTFSIPEMYSGLFEILSEDGRSVRCADSLGDVARKRPEAIVVRDAVNALVPKGNEKNENNENEVNNELKTDLVLEERLVREGERLVPVDQVDLSNATLINPESSASKTASKYLRCLDSNNNCVYLALSSRARVSVLAKDSSISGVHRIASLMRHKRMPLMVRLVSNEVKPLGLKSSQPCCREYRLLSSLSESDLIIALPLTPGHISGPIPLPLEARLKLQTASNMDHLANMEAFKRLVEKTRRVALDLFLTKMAVFDVRDNTSKGLIAGANQRAKIRLRRLRDMHNSKNNAMNNRSQFEANVRNNRDAFDEIEQIYDYIRGMAPLPKSANHTFVNDNNNNNVNNGSSNNAVYSEVLEQSPPSPPPLETLPTRQAALLGGKKRQRLPLSESAENSRPHFLKQSVSTTHLSTRPSTASSSRYHPKLVRPTRLLQPESKALTLSRMNLYSPLPVTKETTPTAPPRYRSLTNLYRSGLNREENHCGTLESSNSGGHTSFGSGSKRIPEKRSRVTQAKNNNCKNENKEIIKETKPLTFLSRPRSLTSLLWTKTSGLVTGKKDNNNVVVVHHYGKHLGVDEAKQGRRTLYL